MYMMHTEKNGSDILATENKIGIELEFIEYPTNIQTEHYGIA